MTVFIAVPLARDGSQKLSYLSGAEFWNRKYEKYMNQVSPACKMSESSFPVGPPGQFWDSPERSWGAPVYDRGVPGTLLGRKLGAPERSSVLLDPSCGIQA